MAISVRQRMEFKEEQNRKERTAQAELKSIARMGAIARNAAERTTLDPYERPQPVTQAQANRNTMIRTQMAPAAMAAAEGAKFVASQDNLPQLLQDLRVENYKAQSDAYRQRAKEMAAQVKAESDSREREIQAKMDAVAARQNPGAKDLEEYESLRKELQQARQARESQNVKGMEDLARLYGDMAFIETLPQSAKDALADYWEVRGGGDASEGTTREYASKAARAIAVLEENGVDAEEIYALAESYSRYQNAEKMQGVQKYWRSHSTGGNAIPAWLAARGANLYGTLTSGAEAFGQGLSHAFGASTYQTADPNASGFRMSANAAAIDQTQTEGIKSAIARTVFKGLNSAADNGLRIVAGQLLGSPNASLGLAGLGSYGSGFQEAAQRGGSVEQATLYGLATGGLEILTEKIPLENLLHMESPDSIKKALLEAAKQGGLEAAEEEISFVGGLIADAIIMGNNSEAKQRERNYIENGMSLAQAQYQVLQDNLLEAAETAAVSFVSGGVMAVGNQIGQAQYNKKVQQAEQEMQAVGGQESLEAKRRRERQEQRPGMQEKTKFAETTEEPAADTMEEPMDYTQKNSLDTAVALQKENGTLSNRQAEAVLKDQAAMAELQQLGYNVTEGTASQKRNAVKTAVAELNGETATAQRTQTPVQEAVADVTRTKKPAISEEGLRRFAEAFPEPERREADFEKLKKRVQNATWFPDGGMKEGTANRYKILLSTFSQEELEQARQEFDDRFLWEQATRSRSERIYDAEPYRAKIEEIADLDGVNITLGVKSLWASGNTYANKEALKDAGFRYDKSRKMWHWEPNNAASPDASVGAAPTGFHSYDELQFMYGNQKDRPATEARPINVPQRDAAGRRVSEVAGNLYGAEMIPDRLLPAFEQAIADGFFSVDKKTWNEQMAEAIASIPEGGEARELRWIIKLADEGKLRNTELAELIVLTNHYAQRPGITGQKLAGEAMVALRELGTEYARGLNMFKMIQRLTPEGQLAAAKAAINRTVDKINRNIKNPDNKRTVQADPDLEQDFLLAAEAAQSGESASAAEASAVISTLEARNEALRQALDESIQKDAEIIRALSELDFAGAEIAANAAENVAQSIQREIEQNWERKDAAERGVARAIARETNIDLAEAQTHAREIVKKFYESLAKKQTAQMEKAFGKLNKKASQNLADKLLSLYLEGDWDEQDRRRAIFDGLWGGDTPVDISDELLEQYAAAAKEGKAQAEQAIYMAAAAQMPGTFAERWNAWRYMMMLGNPATQIRNVAGNAAMTPMWKAKNIIAGAMQDLFRKGEADNTLSASRGGKAMREFAAADAKSKQAQDAMNGIIQGMDNSYREIQAYRKLFKTEALNQAQASLNWVMSGGDMIFKKAAYADVLSRFLHARGYTGEQAQNGQIPADILAEGRNLAVQEAMKATFNDFNTLSNLVTKQYKGTNPIGKAWNALVNGIFPFRRTPANILVRSFDYSPAGLLRGVWNAFRAAKTGEVSMTQAIDQLAAGLTGTGVFVLGSILASCGLITGGWVDDEDEREGYQKYAINIGGYSFTIDWLSPSAIPLFMGAELQHALSGGYSVEGGIDAFIKSTGGIFEPLLEMSMLSSLDDVATRFRQSGSNAEGVMNVLVGAAENYLLQGLPSFGARIDTQFDDNRKIVFANSDSKVLRELEYFAGRAFGRLPFDFFQTEYVDEWGNKEPRGNIAARILATISPTYWNKIEGNSLDEEIKRLEGETGEERSPKATGKSLVIDGETVRLTGEQWTRMQELQGQKAFSMLTQLINDPRYDALTENGKAEIFEKVYDYSRDFARKEVLEGYRETAAWMREADPLAYILKKAEVSDSGLTEAQYDKAKELGKSAEAMRDMHDAVQAALEDTDAPTDYDKYKAVYQAAGTDYDAWLEVYGMSDSRRDRLKTWVQQGNDTGDFFDGLEAASGLTKAIGRITQNWKDGKEPDSASLQQAISAYKNMNKNAKKAAQEQLDGREKALLNAVNAGVSEKTFLNLYKTYYDLSQYGKGAGQNAVQWAAALDRAQQRREITQAQKEQLAKDLRFYAIVPQEAKKYHEMTGQGATTDTALLIGNVLDGLKPKDGRQTVSDTQKWEAILDAPVSDSQKEAALRSYMTDAQEAKLDLAAGYGVGAEIYVDGKTVYDGLSDYGKGRKEQTIQSIQKELGVDRLTAELLYDIYSGKLKE